MGFVTLKGSRAEGAFGLLNRPTKQVKDQLRKAFQKAKQECLLQATPVARREFPLERLCRRFSRILALDVVYQPKLVTCFENSKRPGSRLPTHRKWDVSPVWKVAPPGAVEKSRRVSMLLRTVVTDGWKANIVHDLARLAINIWRMPMKAFDGLCRRIVVKIHKSTTSSSLRSSPDPEVRFSALTSNPIGNSYSVSRCENRKGRVLRSKLRLSSLPSELGVIAVMLGARWRKRFEARVFVKTRVKAQ